MRLSGLATPVSSYRTLSVPTDPGVQKTAPRYSEDEDDCRGTISLSFCRDFPTILGRFWFPTGKDENFLSTHTLLPRLLFNPPPVSRKNPLNPEPPSFLETGVTEDGRTGESPPGTCWNREKDGEGQVTEPRLPWNEDRPSLSTPSWDCLRRSPITLLSLSGVPVFSRLQNGRVQTLRSDIPP